MRHRIGCDCTGLGNSDPVRLNNEWTGNKDIDFMAQEIMSDAVKVFFVELDGCDFQIETNGKEVTVIMGIEPAYKWEKLRIICVSSDENLSYEESGIAWGFYGSGIASKSKRYVDCKRAGPFRNFVDKWVPKLKKIAEEAYA